MDWLVGRAGYAFLDYWVMVHLSFWIVTGSNIAAFKLNRAIFGMLSMSAALMWEGFERFAEPRWPTIWQSPESWWNAWISDPLTVVLGLGLAFVGYDFWRGAKK